MECGEHGCDVEPVRRLMVGDGYLHGRRVDDGAEGQQKCGYAAESEHDKPFPMFVLEPIARELGSESPSVSNTYK